MSVKYSGVINRTAAIKTMPVAKRAISSGPNQAAQTAPPDDEDELDGEERAQVERLEADGKTCDEADENPFPQGCRFCFGGGSDYVGKKEEHNQLLTLTDGIGLCEQDCQRDCQREKKPLSDRQLRDRRVGRESDTRG